MTENLPLHNTATLSSAASHNITSMFGTKELEHLALQDSSIWNDIDDQPSSTDLLEEAVWTSGILKTLKGVTSTGWIC